jgi:hypothetical protein
MVERGAKVQIFYVICQKVLDMVVGTMKRGFLFILLVLAAGLGFGQAGSVGVMVTGSGQEGAGRIDTGGMGTQPGTVAGLVRAFRFVDSVLGRTFTYGIAGPDIPKEVKDILARFDSAIAANKQWFEEYRSRSAAGGKPLPYDPRFGISAEEYQRLQQLERQPPRLVIIAQKNVTVARERNVLHFRGEDEARIFGYLEVDLQQQRIVFAGDTLPYAGSMKADQLAAFHLTQGYSWRFQKVDVNSTLQNYRVTARVAEIDMGVAADGGRTFLLIKYQDMKEGVSQADLDLTGFVL